MFRLTRMKLDRAKQRMKELEEALQCKRLAIRI
jgi:hypothetical protein